MKSLTATAFIGALFAAAASAQGLEFSRLRLFIEFNDTAQDVGVQLLLDGEPWKTLRAFDPQGDRILDVKSLDSLRTQGLTEFFFESSEPALTTVPLAVFLARFPAGNYEFEGVTVDNMPIEGEATFGHSIPAGPVIITPLQGEEPPVVDPTHLVIEWEPVTTTIFGDPIEIIGYQVIVEQVEPRRVLLMDLPGDVTSTSIPPEFFAQAGVEHLFEVLAIEAGQNQTITEGSFITAP